MGGHWLWSPATRTVQLLIEAEGTCTSLREYTVTVTSKFPSHVECLRFWVIPWTIFSRTTKGFFYTSFKLQTFNKTGKKFIPRNSVETYAFLKLNKSPLQWITTFIAVCLLCEMETYSRKALLCNNHRTRHRHRSCTVIGRDIENYIPTSNFWQGTNLTNFIELYKKGNKKAKVKHIHGEGLA